MGTTLLGILDKGVSDGNRQRHRAGRMVPIVEIKPGSLVPQPVPNAWQHSKPKQRQRVGKANRDRTVAAIRQKMFVWQKLAWLLMQFKKGLPVKVGARHPLQFVEAVLNESSLDEVRLKIHPNER